MMNAANDLPQMLQDIFYYGFTRQTLAERKKGHDKWKKGPLGDMSPEDLEKVKMIRIHHGKSSTNKILEALFIALECDMINVLKNKRLEPINCRAIENLINFHSIQRQHVINILTAMLERSIKAIAPELPTPQSRKIDDHAFQEFLAILKNKTMTSRERLLGALEFVHQTQSNNRKCHTYAVCKNLINVTNLDLIPSTIIYIGKTLGQLQRRQRQHTKDPNSAIYNELNKPNAQSNIHFVQLLWKNTSEGKCLDFEAMLLWLIFKNKLSNISVMNRQLERIHSKFLKRILLDKDNKYNAQLKTLIDGIHQNMTEAVQRFQNAHKDGENLEFIWYPCQWHFPNGDRCTYAAARTDTLQLHERVHTGERPYACRYPISETEVCTYAAARSDALQIHERIHTGERPYACRYRISETEVCSFAAASSPNMLVHERVHTGDRPYACTYHISETEICTYAAARTDTLQIHQRVHTGERPYACTHQISVTEVCTYAAARSVTLQIHERRHTGERPYKCDLPGCTFTTGDPANLYRHKQTHTGKKFTCEVKLDDGSICNTSYSRSDTLKRHMRRKHDIQ